MMSASFLMTSIWGAARAGVDVTVRELGGGLVGVIGRGGEGMGWDGRTGSQRARRRGGHC